jgi:uncharacterized protein (TIGR02594 family)
METQMTPTPAPWIDIARAEIGQHEIAGAQTNPRIVEYFRATALDPHSDEVPWCSAFVNWCLSRVGIDGTRSAAAASWRTWGAACTPQIGCIVVVQHDVPGPDGATGSASGFHVGFLLRLDDTHVHVLGGNQGDQVKESAFPLASYRVVATRWPSEKKAA